MAAESDDGQMTLAAGEAARSSGSPVYILPLCLVGENLLDHHIFPGFGYHISVLADRGQNANFWNTSDHLEQQVPLMSPPPSLGYVCTLNSSLPKSWYLDTSGRIEMGKFANGPRRATMTAVWPSARRVPKILPRCFRRRRRLAGEARRFLRRPFIFALTSCRMTNCARAQAQTATTTATWRTAAVLTNAGVERREGRPEMSARPESCSDLRGDLGRRGQWRTTGGGGRTQRRAGRSPARSGRAR